MKRNVLSSLLLLLLFILVPSEAWSQERVVQMPNRHQLSSVHVRVLFQDKEGYMWYGMKSDGLCRDDGYNLVSFRSDFLHPDMQFNNNITALCEDSKNRIWIGTKRGLYILDKHDYSIRPTGDDVLQTWTIDALKASTGDSVWAFANNHLLVYDGEGTCISRTIVESNPLVTQSRKEITDHRGNFWQIDDDGIPTIQTRPVATLEEVDLAAQPLHYLIPPKQSGLSSDHKVHTVWRSADGTRWIGTSLGVWTVPADSVGDEAQQVGPNFGVVNTLSPDADGTLYLNTEWQGLISYRNGVIAKLDSTLRNANALFADEGKLWISTYDGRLLLYDVAKKTMEDHSLKCHLTGDAPLGLTVLDGDVWLLFNQRILIYSPQGYGLRSIFPSDLDPQPRFFRGLYTDGISRIFIECERQSYELRLTSSAPPKDTPDRIFLSAYETVSGLHTPGIDNLQLDLEADEHACHLYFTTLDHIHTQNVRFAYRYDGEADWHYLEMGENDILLTHLTPGNHTIEVMATNADGQWLPDTITVDLHCAAHWWETPWAYIGYALIAILLLLGAFWLGRKFKV